MSGNSRNDILTEDIVALVPVLRNFARRFYPNMHDAEDLVQETIVKSLSNLDKFQDGTNLKSWMFTVMRNSFCTRFGRSKREPLVPSDAITDWVTTEAPQDWRLAELELQRAIGHLPNEQRNALLLIVFEGATYEEVAAKGGCAIGTIKSRVNRARERLAAEIGWNDL